MRSRTGLFTTTAVIEVGTGIALLIAPSAVVWLLLGISSPSPTALVAARAVGVALLALGGAAWMSRGVRPAGTRPDLLYTMLAYNLGIGIVLAALSIAKGISGVLLWPVVVLHAGMALWCVLYLRSGPSGARAED